MRFRIVTCILLILPVFSSVLAAPIPVREVRSDATEGTEDVMIMSEKRAPRGARNLYTRDGGMSSDNWRTPNFASGNLPGVGKPSPLSGGGDSPLWSKVWSTPNGAEATYPEGVALPGTTQPASTNKAKTVQWGSTKYHTYEKYPVPLPPPPGREGYLANLAKQTLPKPQPKSFGSKLKGLFGWLGKFRPRSHTRA